ncbi:MAG TPA: heme exporter protein CcmD [Chiayiivirga sp.]|nr:heme exporter protein CcmD [Chiayiivirga sp.]
MNFVLDQYAPYVWSSYALFLAFLLWDYFSPRLRMARARQQIKSRLKREAQRKRSGGAA